MIERKIKNKKWRRVRVEEAKPNDLDKLLEKIGCIFIVGVTLVLLFCAMIGIILEQEQYARESRGRRSSSSSSSMDGSSVYGSPYYSYYDSYSGSSITY